MVANSDPKDTLCRRCATSLTGMSRNARFCSAYCRGMAWHEARHVPAPKPTALERFASHVGPTDDRGCTQWTGATFGPDGYGAFVLDGQTIGAHRAAWILARGAIGAGLVVRHKCDNRPCVNVEHLELGTHLDNARDCIRRERKATGHYSILAKLTDDQVAEIRNLYASGEWTQRELGRRFGVTQARVWQVIHDRARTAPSLPGLRPAGEGA